jgi:CIC family chloride channel protein
MRNINIKEGADENIMAAVSVKDVYSPEFSSLLVNDDYFKIINKVIKSKKIDFPVVNNDSEIYGMISIVDIKEHLNEGEDLQNILIAGDIARNDFEMINEEADGKTAMQIMSKYDFTGLPVFNIRNPRKVIGMLWRKDLHEAYMRESETRDLSSNLASSIVMKDSTQQVHFWEGYSVTEIIPPKSFLNKSIRDLNIRAIYGVQILSIKTTEKGSFKVSALPNPDHILKEGDVLVIAGENKYITVLKNMP